MKPTTALFTAAVLAQALAVDLDDPKYYHWKAPKIGDVRSPCPMLNSLANHGFLPHNGKYISVNETISALGALYIDHALAEYLFSKAAETNPEPNATTFSLDHLSRHNVLEHDASLSRADYYFEGDAHNFNPTVFDQTMSYWTDETISIQQGADSRLARVEHSTNLNPNFELSPTGESFGTGEVAAYLMIFSENKTAGAANKKQVQFLFENELLPIELGWSPPKETIFRQDLSDMQDRVIAASSAKLGRGNGIHDA